MGISAILTIARIFLFKWIKTIWSGLIWLVSHPIAIVGLVGVIIGSFIGHYWTESGANKKVLAIQKQLDDRDAAEKARLAQIGMKSTLDADTLGKEKQAQLDKANATIADYKKRLKNNKTIVYVPQLIHVPANGKNAAQDIQTNIGIQNGSVVCNRLPSTTEESINKLIKGSNEWYPPPSSPPGSSLH